MAKKPDLLFAKTTPDFDQISNGNLAVTFEWKLDLNGQVWEFYVDDINISLKISTIDGDLKSWKGAVDIEISSPVVVTKFLASKRREISNQIDIEESTYVTIVETLNEWAHFQQNIRKSVADFYSQSSQRQLDFQEHKRDYLHTFYHDVSRAALSCLENSVAEEVQFQNSNINLYNNIANNNFKEARDHHPLFVKFDSKSKENKEDLKSRIQRIRRRRDDYHQLIKDANSHLENLKSEIRKLRDEARQQFPNEGITWPAIPEHSFEPPNLPTQPPDYFLTNTTALPREVKDLSQEILEIAEAKKLVIAANTEAFQTALDGARKEFEQKKQRTFAELDEVYRRLGLDRAKIAAHELSGGYNQTSKGWKKQADQWDILVKRASAALILLVLVLILLEITGFTPNTPAGSLATKLSYTLLGAGFIAYAAKSASKARRQQRIYEQRGVELAMLRDFLAESNPEDRQEIIKTLAPRYFGESLEAPSGPQSRTDSPAPMEQLLPLLKQLQDLQKPGKSD